MLDKLLNRLTDNYSKNKNSNIGKLFSVISDELAEVEKALIDIKLIRDVDKASEKTLDNIGNNVLEYRNQRNDKDYKQFIKIKVLANRSDGNIPVINHILQTYMGDNFISIEDGWSSYVEEPASMVVNIRSAAKDIPMKVLDRIKAAGVRVYFTAGSEATNIILDFRSYEIPVKYRICNMFRTDDVAGVLGKAIFDLTNKSYSFDVEYPICNTFVAQGNNVATSQANIILANEYRDNEILYLRTGNTTIGEGDI